ncbi:unnamed protein product [Mytilus coruscus]|uniref:Uncharacterized protein n=1 Tax=Mytilus coruscus TaxID=42192 RepID=A0A6J8DN19_MYTCO|nr:unnamed protein product [Mytilus coruscus]
MVSYNFSNSWITTEETTTGETPIINDYDSTGALTFVVVVIMVYGFSVVLVFLFNFYKSKQTDHDELDRQAIVYVKGIDSVRRTLEQRERMNSAANMMKSVSSASDIKELLPNQFRRISCVAVPLLMTSNEQHQKPIFSMGSPTEECDQNFNSKDVSRGNGDRLVQYKYTVDDILEELSDECFES